ncbi:MAG: hypothetical protein AAF518_17595 [Spirochaetota bacterium]
MKFALLLLVALQITFCSTTMQNISKTNPRIFITYEDAQETSKKVWQIHDFTLNNGNKPQTTYQIKNLIMGQNAVAIDLPNGKYTGILLVAKDTGYFSTSRTFIKFQDQAEYSFYGQNLSRKELEELIPNYKDFEFLYQKNKEFKFPTCYMEEAENFSLFPFLITTSNFTTYSCPPIQIEQSTNYTLKLVARKLAIPAKLDTKDLAILARIVNSLGIEDIVLRIETTK